MDNQNKLGSQKIQEILERIKQTFAKCYPEYYARAMSATDEEFDEVYKNIVSEVRAKSLAKIQASDMPEELKMSFVPMLGKTQKDDDVHYADSFIMVGQSTCDLLVNSRGDEIAVNIMELLESQQQLQQKLSNPDSLSGEEIVEIVSKCLSVIGSGIAATTSIALGIMSITVAAATTPAGIIGIIAGVVAILDVLICQVVLPLIKWFVKEAVCFMLLVNKTNKNIKMVEGCDAHGHSESMTREISKIEVESNDAKNHVYSVGMYFTKKNKGALYGTKYGMQFNLIEDNTKFAVGVECPLNGPNKCYVAFNQTARQAADGTQKKKSQYASASNDCYVIEQRCDTKESEIAFFITTITEYDYPQLT